MPPSCEDTPGRMKNAKGSACDMEGMGFAMKSKITMQSSTMQSAQLGVMTNCLKNVDMKPGAKLSKCNFDDTCQQFFTQADRPGGPSTSWSSQRAVWQRGI